MGLPKQIHIREVGPREGFQILNSVVATDKKAQLIKLLSDSGLSEIEVTSFVSPKRVPQMADAEELVAKLPKNSKAKFTGLYLNPEGFNRAEATSKLQNSAWVNIACSETFLKKNANTSLSEIIAALPEWLSSFEQANKRFHGIMVSTAFGCSYEGRVSLEQVKSVISRFVEALDLHGVYDIKEICLADTMGWGNPVLVKNVIRLVYGLLPKAKISLHLHDTRGAGVANFYAGLEEGIECFDSSIGGLGGCPFSKGAAGNVATEDIVYLAHEMGIKTGIDLDKLVLAVKFAESIVGSKLPGRYAYSI